MHSVKKIGLTFLIICLIITNIPMNVFAEEPIDEEPIPALSQNDATEEFSLTDFVMETGEILSVEQLIEKGYLTQGTKEYTYTYALEEQPEPAVTLDNGILTAIKRGSIKLIVTGTEVSSDEGDTSFTAAPTVSANEVIPTITPEVTDEVTPTVTPEVTDEVTPTVTPTVTPEVTDEPTQEKAGVTIISEEVPKTDTLTIDEPVLPVTVKETPIPEVKESIVKECIINVIPARNAVPSNNGYKFLATDGTYHAFDTESGELIRTASVTAYWNGESSSSINIKTLMQSGSTPIIIDSQNKAIKTTELDMMKVNDGVDSCSATSYQPTSCSTIECKFTITDSGKTWTVIVPIVIKTTRIKVNFPGMTPVGNNFEVSMTRGTTKEFAYSFVPTDTEDILSFSSNSNNVKINKIEDGKIEIEVNRYADEGTNAVISMDNGFGYFETITVKIAPLIFDKPAMPSLVFSPNVQDVTVKGNVGKLETNSPDHYFYRITATEAGTSTPWAYCDTMSYDNLLGAGKYQCTIGAQGTKEDREDSDDIHLKAGTQYNITATIMEVYWDENQNKKIREVSEPSDTLSVTTAPNTVPADIKIISVASTPNSVDSIHSYDSYHQIKQTEGDIVTVKVQVYDINKMGYANQTVTWSIGGASAGFESKETVTDASGYCTASVKVGAGGGTFDISAKCGRQVARVSVVKKTFEKNLKLRSNATVDLYTGQSKYFTFVEYSTGTSERKVTWSASGDGEVVFDDINSDDLIITGTKEGTVTVTATAEGNLSSASMTVRVHKGINKIEFVDDINNHLVCARGSNFKLEAKLNDGAITQTNENITFRVEKPTQGVRIVKKSDGYYLDVPSNIPYEERYVKVTAYATDYPSNQNMASGRLKSVSYLIADDSRTFNRASVSAIQNGTQPTADSLSRTIIRGNEGQLNGSYLVITDADGGVIPSDELNYSVRNQNILAVDRDGKITVNSVGTTSVIASASATHQEMQVIIRVKENPITILGNEQQTSASSDKELNAQKLPQQNQLTIPDIAKTDNEINTFDAIPNIIEEPIDEEFIAKNMESVALQSATLAIDLVLGIN